MFLGYAFTLSPHSLESTANVSSNFETVTISNAKFDELYLSNNTSISTGTTFPTDWDYSTCMHALFSNNLSAGNVDFYTQEITKIIVRRRKVGTTQWVNIAEKSVDDLEDMNFTYYDITVRNNVEYEYTLAFVIGSTETSTDAVQVTTDFDGMVLCNQDGVYVSLLDTSVTTNRNKVTTIINTLNRKYPFVINVGNDNYDSGTAKAVWLQYDSTTDDWTLDNAHSYRHSINDFLMDGKPKLLKMWDGRMWLVSISGTQITEEQEAGYEKVTTSFEWTEVGDCESSTDLYANGITNSAYSGSGSQTPLPIGIVVVTPPTKTTYRPYNTVDLTGIVVDLEYDDGSIAILSANEVSCSPTKVGTAGTSVIAITYTDTTTSTTLSTAISFTVEDYDFTTWSGIQSCVANGEGALRIPLGTTFTTPMYTGDDISWKVLGHDLFVSPDKPNGHTMTLGAYYNVNTQFDAPEAIYYAENGLTAGDYSITLIGNTRYFTLTQDIPVGGQLYLINDSNFVIKSYASASSTTPIETTTYSTTIITGATSLGTVGNGMVNHWYRTTNGSNNYKESAIRQYINSTQPANQWWQPKSVFDRPPSNASSPSLLSLVTDDEFLDALVTTTVKCKTNNVYESPYSDTTAGVLYTINDKIFIISSKEGRNSEDKPYDGSFYLPFRTYVNGVVYWYRNPSVSNTYSVCYESGSSIRSDSAYYTKSIPLCCNIG